MFEGKSLNLSGFPFDKKTCTSNSLILNVQVHASTKLPTWWLGIASSPRARSCVRLWNTVVSKTGQSLPKATWPRTKRVYVLMGEADPKQRYSSFFVTVVPLMCYGEPQGAKRQTWPSVGNWKDSTKGDVLKLGSRSLPRTFLSKECSAHLCGPYFDCLMRSPTFSVSGISLICPPSSYPLNN